MKVEFGAYGTMYCADCLEILPTLADKSVDLVCTDPPNLLQDEMNYQFQDGTDDQLFANIDFDSFAKQLKRTAKDKSSICVFGHSNFQVLIHNAFKPNGLKYVMDLIWEKSNSVNFIHSQVKPLSKHELITLWKSQSLNYDFAGAKDYGFKNYNKK